MKSTVFAAAFACLWAVSAPLALAQQATLVVKSQGRDITQAGEVTGAGNGAVKFKFLQAGKPQEVAIPLTNIVSIQMAPPKDFDEGGKLFSEGKDLLALTKYAVVENQFKGLPTPWMAVTLARLGQLHIRLNQYDKAEAFFAEYSQIFTGENALPLADLGKAQIAFAKGDNDTAKTLLESVAEKAKTIETATEQQSNFFANTFFTLGQVQEAANDLTNALESYLKVVTLYYRDTTLLTAAETKAAALRKAHPEVSVP